MKAPARGKRTDRIDYNNYKKLAQGEGRNFKTEVELTAEPRTELKKIASSILCLNNNVDAHTSQEKDSKDHNLHSGLQVLRLSSDCQFANLQ